MITSVNKVHFLAEDEKIFDEAVPPLLGRDCEKKMKAHLESLKCLSASAYQEGWTEFSPKPPPFPASRELQHTERRIRLQWRKTKHFQAYN